MLQSVKSQRSEHDLAGDSSGKNLPANAGDRRDADSIPRSGRSPGGQHSYPLQCSCLENPRGRGAWWAAVYGVAQSWTRLKRLSSSSSIYLVVLVVNNPPANAEDIKDTSLIPEWGRSPGGGHGNPLKYSCLENPHGQRILAGCSPCGHKGLNMTE